MTFSSTTSAGLPSCGARYLPSFYPPAMAVDADPLVVKGQRALDDGDLPSALASFWSWPPRLGRVGPFTPVSVVTGRRESASWGVKMSSRFASVLPLGVGPVR